MNDAVARADLVVAVGIVEPHLYAGFSGGVKAVAIGCAGQETIAWTHHPVFLDQPAVRLCRLDGNPFQEALREIAAATRLRFALNVVLSDGGGVAGVAAGDPAAVQRQLAQTHGAAWIRRHEQPFDLVVAGVPAPKDRSLYQASRAATYVGLAARPVLADGGLIVCCADLPLGVGDGPGETNFGGAAGRHRTAPRPRGARLRRAARPRRAARLHDGQAHDALPRRRGRRGRPRAHREPGAAGLRHRRRGDRRDEAASAAPAPGCWPSPTASTPIVELADQRAPTESRLPERRRRSRISTD